MLHEEALINLNDISNLKENGIIKIKYFLNENELKEIIDIAKSRPLPHEHPKSYCSTNIRLLLYKILRLNFKRFKQEVKILSLAKKKNLNFIADQIFNKKSYLDNIDLYHTPISEENSLPWHADQAYQGDEKNYEGFVNPDHDFVKFFIYLTDVDSDNGCTSYIPKSHKIAYAIRKGIFERNIKYQPYFTLKEFRNFISKKENADFIKSFLNDNDIIDEFLKKTNFVDEKGDTNEFDFSLKAGDAIIFDEGGLHKAARSTLSERMVLRYIYSVRKRNIISDIFIRKINKAAYGEGRPILTN